MARNRRSQARTSRTVAKPSPRPAGFVRRAGAWLMGELREMVAPTAFFFVGFNLIVLTTNLLLADYTASSAGTFMLATVSALIVGKSVLIANAMPFLRRYDDHAPLIEPILFRTLGYSVIVALVRCLNTSLNSRASMTSPCETSRSTWSRRSLGIALPPFRFGYRSYS